MASWDSAPIVKPASGGAAVKAAPWQDAPIIAPSAPIAAPVEPPMATAGADVSAAVQGAGPQAANAAGAAFGGAVIDPNAVPAPVQPEPTYDAPGMIVPIQFGTDADGNRVARPAVPQMVSGAIDAAGSAIAGPGRALQGDPSMMPTIDPVTGAVNNTPPAMIDSVLDTVGMVAGNGPGMAARGMTGADPRMAAQAAALATQKAADEFGIPLTRGQANKSLLQMTQEELLRQGDGQASTVMRNFDATQQDAIGAAVNNLSANAGANAGDVGPTVLNALNKIVSDKRESAEQLYGKAFGGGLKIQSSAINVLPETVAKRLSDEAVYIDNIAGGGITPVANAALRIIDDTAASLPVKADGTVDLAQSLSVIERLRRRLVQLEGNTGEDRNAVRQIKAGFDEWLDNAVDTSLISGDDEALEALKAARAEWSAYKNLSTAKTGDQAQQAVVKMQKQDATAEEVANWLYGADVASPSLAAPKVAQRVRAIVGADSDAWGAVRAAAVERLTKDLATDTPRSPLMISNRIDQFLNSKGETLSKVLFSDEERDALQRFSDTLKTTITPRDATNPSRTASTLLNAGKKLSGQMSGVAGTVVGGPGLGIAALLAVPIFKNAKDIGAALKAVTRSAAPEAISAAPFSTSNALARAAAVVPSEAEQPDDDIPPDAPTQTIDGRSYFQKPDGTWWEII